MTTKSWALIAVICIVFFIVLVTILVIRKKRREQAGSIGSANEQIYVGNLPYHITENHLRDYFKKFGNIQSIRVIRNVHTGASKGYAFVTYKRSHEAESALDSHGKEIFGRTMVVRIAKPRSA